MRTIGQNIRYYRILRGYSQEKLAEMADINDKLVGFYETVPTDLFCHKTADSNCHFAVCHY